MSAFLLAAAMAAVAAPVVLALLILRAERRIQARLDRLMYAVGMETEGEEPRPRIAPGLGELEGLRAEREPRTRPSPAPAGGRTTKRGARP